MPHGHGVDICSLRLRGNVDNSKLGRADLRLRYSSGISCFLPIDCGVCVRIRSGADGDDGDGDGDGMVMVLVIVLIVPEVLRQVGWVHPCQHQSFHRLRAFY
jgi:hypothetical protein